MWDARYSSKGYVYGTEPNEFLKQHVHRIPKGRVLSLAEGEGRNAVYVASQGYEVTGVDSSVVGLEKAQRLAHERSVQITTVVADLAQFQIEPNSWDAIISIFCHLPSAQRAEVHRRVVAGLRPGGCLLLEAYTPKQLAFKTGGPQDPDLLPDLESLKRELAGLHFEIAAELEREVNEGIHHNGRGAVVQILAFKNS
ncbi:MAG: class I SAM-dependent methyltransferase [Chloroflexota bacterium]